MQRAGDGERLHGVEAEAEGHQQQDRHQDAQPALAEAVLDVERRAAAIGAVRFAALVQLGQRAFEIAGGHAHQGHYPHPEDRARAAEHDRHRDAGDVACTDPAGDREHQRLEGGELSRLPLEGVAEDREHVAEIAELDEAGTDGEEQTQADQHNDQQFAPDKVVEKVEHGDVHLVVVVRASGARRCAVQAGDVSTAGRAEQFRGWPRCGAT